MNIIIFSDTNGALGFGRYAGPYRVATNEKPVLNLVNKKIDLKNNYIKRVLNE